MSQQPPPTQPPPKPPLLSNLVQNYACVGAVAGIIVMWFYGKTYFPDHEDGTFNWQRMLGAVGVAVVGAVVGGGIGKAIEMMQKK
jgi:hypothetical protein